MCSFLFLILNFFIVDFVLNLKIKLKQNEKFSSTFDSTWQTRRAQDEMLNIVPACVFTLFNFQFREILSFLSLYFVWLCNLFSVK